jgi:hypothetical protein
MRRLLIAVAILATLLVGVAYAGDVQPNTLPCLTCNSDM